MKCDHHIKLAFPYSYCVKCGEIEDSVSVSHVREEIKRQRDLLTKK